MIRQVQPKTSKCPRWLAPAMGLVLALGGCATVPAPGTSTHEPVITAQPTTPAPMEEILIPDPEPRDPSIVPERRLVTVAARDAEIQSVLLTVADQAGLNLVVDEGVHGRVSLEMRDVPVSEALEAIISKAGYHYRLHDGLLRVYGDGRQTRVFTLDYIMSVRQGSTTMTASSGGLNGASTQSSSSGGSSESESQVSVNSSSSLDPWKDLIRGLELIVFGEGSTGSAEIVGQPAGGDAATSAPAAPEGSIENRDRLVVHPMTGVILVTASFQKLNRVADFLERIEGASHRQVLIEARVVEVTRRSELEFGIDWSRIPGVSTDVTSVFSDNDDEIAAEQNLSPDNGAFQIAGSIGEFDALLDALATQGRVKVLSSPRVATLNNQKAVIKVAREESFFSQQIDYETNPDGSSSPIVTVEPQRVTIGLVLDVVPQISAGGDIMMNIHPSITELAGEDVFPPGASGGSILANAPILDIREVDTVVRVKDGFMLIIGGLMKDRTSNEVRKVPILGDLPLIGSAFRHTHKVDEHVELVIAIRPRLVIGSPAKGFEDLLGARD